MMPGITAESVFIRSIDGGTLVADGNEQDLHLNNAPANTFEPQVVIVNLDNMQGGDTIVLRVYYRITAAGNLEQHTFTQYAGADGGLANSNIIASTTLLPNTYGIQITLEQTGGVNRNYDWYYESRK